MVSGLLVVFKSYFKIRRPLRRSSNDIPKRALGEGESTVVTDEFSVLKHKSPEEQSSTLLNVALVPETLSASKINTKLLKVPVKNEPTSIAKSTSPSPNV